MFKVKDINKMKREAKRRRDQQIKQCKKEHGNKGSKAERKRPKFIEEAA